MISFKLARSLVTPPRLVVPLARTTLPRVAGEISPTEMEHELRAMEEVFVHNWASDWRQVVIGVDAAGRLDSYEWLSEISRARLAHFKGKAVIGLTDVPRATRLGRLTASLRLRAFRNGEARPLWFDTMWWFDALDLNTGDFYDYDSAFHFVSRLAHFPWIDGVWRGGFRHVVGHVGAVSVQEWIRAMFAAAPAFQELYVRDALGTRTSTGAPKRYLLRRRDWERMP